jgi:hypothetical protein
MFKDCATYCRTCPKCQAYAKHIFPRMAVRPIFPTGPFEKWGLNFVPMTALRNKYLIVATDYLTKWTEAAIVKKNTREVVADFLFNQIVCRYGCPLEIVSDQGSHFVNDLIQELLQSMSVKHRKATPYYPQANGLVEKFNRIVCGILAKVVKDNRKNWDQHVGGALWAYRTAHKLPTDYTPF